MSKQVLIGTVALLAFTAAGFAWAQPGDGGPRGPRGHGNRNPEQRIERMIEKLDLSDEQAANIKGIHEEGQAARLTIQKELRRLQNKIEGEMLKDTVNKQTIVSLTQQAGDKRTEARILAVQLRLEVRDVLTPEQRDKFMMMHAGRKGACGQGQRQGRGHGWGRGR